MKPIIYSSELKEIFNDDIVVFDARTGKNSFEDYLQKHIKNARYIDLDKDLANVGENVAFGGRHPLPSLENFLQKLENFGVSEEKHIVIYDTSNGANAAARLWWMLKSFGLENVQVLSGGLQAAEKSGVELSQGVENFDKGNLKERTSWKFPLSTIEDVEVELFENTATVIDVRDACRYNGESEPIDLVAGHIPGAINVPFIENLDAEGNFLSPEILREKYQQILANLPGKLIIHCGSGVTACHTILAMDYAGLPIPSLYIGSWSEWSRREKPIAVKK